MKILNKLIQIQIQIIFYIINFQIIVINCKGNVHKGRAFHKMAYVRNYIYFLGGYIEQEATYTNDFFHLDISNHLNKNDGLIFGNLSIPSFDILQNDLFAIGGESNDKIFLFTENNKSVNYFSVTERKWQSPRPFQTTSTNAATDDHGNIYLFDDNKNNNNHFPNIIQIALPGMHSHQRYGYTATYLPRTGEIIFIGGYKI